MPRMLRRDLADFEVRTTQEEGWSGLTNGELLRAAEAKFAVLVTGDKRLQFQQNIAAFNIAIVVVSARSTRLVHMRPLVERIKQAIEQTQPGTVCVVTAG